MLRHAIDAFESRSSVEANGACSHAYLRVEKQRAGEDAVACSLFSFSISPAFYCIAAAAAATSSFEQTQVKW